MAEITRTIDATAGEGTPLQSKKFVAFTLAEITWKILAGLVLFWGKDAMPDQQFIVLLAIIVVAGFVEVGFILGQASLDKFVRLAKIAALTAGAKIDSTETSMGEDKSLNKPG